MVSCYTKLNFRTVMFFDWGITYCYGKLSKISDLESLNFFHLKPFQVKLLFLKCFAEKYARIFVSYPLPPFRGEVIETYQERSGGWTVGRGVESREVMVIHKLR